ncbi:hypothetical protein DVH05_016824 [Phytophthora capsici]|nr:hypothetical protein DVH05_016824 [Phytophthora capsici]
MCVVRLPETGQHSAERAALDFIVPHPDAFHRYQYLQHAHRHRLVAQGHHPTAHGADNPLQEQPLQSMVDMCSKTTFLSASELSYEERYVEDGQSGDE